MEKTYKVFAINPGSTSTKIALFENEEKVFSVNVTHEAQKLKTFHEIKDQLEFRTETIMEAIRENGVSLEGVDAFAARTGGLASMEGGVYELDGNTNQILAEHAFVGFAAKHPNNLGPRIAMELANVYGGRVFVVNPPDVDELDDVERITGLHEVFRRAGSHALNLKENGIRYAKGVCGNYEEMNLIICHIGGGVSVSAHRCGKIVSCNNIVDGDGPMAPTRAGALPALDLLRLCFSGKYTEKELYDRITKTGGLADHLGTSEVLDILKMIEGGDRYAKLIYDAFIYQIAKAAGGCAAALRGMVDGIILTGGIARDNYLVDELKGYLSWIAPISVQAGEFEMEALAAGAIRVMSGEEKGKIYTGIPVFTDFEHLKADEAVAV
ncbi:MAG: butyrate kinase [Lachnospiraceae bacterium]|jgi:butyrate kinase|nr:butyrate kinase [Lachnospiraceae bacterium]